jgi:hypothetical protein
LVAGVATLTRSLAIAFAAALTGCSGCGKLVGDDDSGQDANADGGSGAGDATSDVAAGVVCQAGTAVDASPDTPGTWVCPPAWNCVSYSVAGAPLPWCCPPNETCTFNGCDPDCFACNICPDMSTNGCNCIDGGTN